MAVQMAVELDQGNQNRPFRAPLDQAQPQGQRAIVRQNALEVENDIAAQVELVVGIPQNPGRSVSAAVAITAGIIGIVALPVISALILVATPLATALLAFFARFSTSEERRTRANGYLFSLIENLPFVVAGLIPGASLVATAFYLNNTTPNPDGSRRVRN
jgi:hypothetical protein